MIDAFNRALAFAAERHAPQVRKGTRIPYITHAVAVAELLARYYPDHRDLILAGLLHDTVEDTDATREVVEARFGPRVAALVLAVTKPDDQDLTDLPADQLARWQAKREAMLAHLDTQDLDVLRLKAADALANLSAIRRDLADPAVGEAVWSRFKAPKELSLWYYASVVARVDAGIGHERLAEELREVLEVIRSGRSHHRGG